MMESNNRSDFPLLEDITIDILLRLPFASILACKRVSKRWKNLLNETKFHKLYRSKSIVVFLDDKASCCILIRQEYKIVGYPPFTVHRLPTPFRFESRVHHLVSRWSKGIVCIKELSGPFHVYNLFTGASYDVEEAPVQRECFDRSLQCCGFGYDHYDDDYKILVVYKYCLDVLNTSLFWVYSLRNRGWESYHGFPYATYRWSIQQQPICYDGVLHWVLKMKEEPLHVIVTYDLHTRRFGEISVPSIAYGKKCLEGIVTELDGRLCFMKNTLLLVGYDIEVYCVGASWTKLFNIHLPLGSKFSLFGLANTMLYERRDERKEVLLVSNYENRLYLCDIKKNAMTIWPNIVPGCL